MCVECIMSYSTYVLNQKISNLQYDLNTLIPTGFPATISALVIPPSINVLDVVDTIIVEDGLGSGNNSTITSVEVSLTNGLTTDYLSITPTTLLIDSITNTASTTINFASIIQQSGLLTNTTSVLGTILTDGTNTITTTPTQISIYDGGINTTTIQANTTNYTNGIDTLNIYPSFVQVNSGGGSAVLAGNVLNIQGSGDVDCQVFNTHIDFTSGVGVVANSLTSSAWSGGIASQSTVMNANHYILGSMTDTTSNDIPQKNSNLYFNPSLQTLYSTTFSGNLTGTASIANTINTNTYNLATTCYIPFTSSTAGSEKALYVDDTTGPLSYVPSTSTLTASIFSGALSGNATSASTVSTVSDNTAGTYYLPFVKTTALLTPNQHIYIDDTTGPLTYNPSTGALSSTSFVGTVSGNASSATTSTNVTVSALATGTYYLCGSPSLVTGSVSLQTDSLGHLAFNSTTNNLLIGGSGGGSITMASLGSALSIAGNGTAISCPSATAISFPLANVSATTFTGALSGNATSSTTVSTVSDNTSGTYYLPFVKTTALLTPNQQIYIDDTTGPLTYNPSTGALTSTSFVGALSGNATTATTSTNSYLNASSTGSINYNIVMSSGLTGSNGLYTDYDADVYYNPSTHTFTATTFSGALSGNATSSTTVSTVSDNTAGTYYLPFVKTTALLTPNQQIYIDDTTGPLTYNPSTGALSSTSFVGTVSGASSGVNLPTTQNLATFATGVLTWTGLSSQSFKNSNIIFTGTTNIVATLTTSQQQVNGEYYLSGYNAGTGTLTFNYPLLGTNIKTTYSSAVNIPTLTYFLMKINVLVANAITLTIVDIKQLS